MSGEQTTGKDVLTAADDNNVRFVRLLFTDVLGFLKSFAISVDELENALEDGVGFDGSSIEGYARVHESDMLALPDPGTFVILPGGTAEQGRVGGMFCDILEPDGTPYEADPRYILKRNLRKAGEYGYSFFVGPELEYFYFRDAACTEPLDSGGYFDLAHLDLASMLRRDTAMALQDMGIPVELSHHEVSPSQHEIDLRYADGLTMADRSMTYRRTVKEVAATNGVYATFMPKPLYGRNGSGMHLHMSLFEGEGEDVRNAFFDPEDEFGLSPLARAFTAGLLTHAREICSVCAQWVNSYKRLVPGFEAPVYISWGRRNRSTLVRVPMYKPGREHATRVEFRLPDPACNPYLAFSAVLAAGFKGVEEKYVLPEPNEQDVFELGEQARADRGMECLPLSLAEAIAETESSQLVRGALGDHIFEKFIQNKKMEWEEYRTHISRFEVDRYLPLL